MSEQHAAETSNIRLTPAIGLLGLLPSLAIATTLVKGFSIGVIIALIFVGTSVVCALLRDRIADPWRIPFLLTVSALLTTLLQMNLAAFLFAVYAALGLFVPLVAVNGLIFTRGLSVAFQRPVIASLRDAIVLSINVVLVLTLLGALREFFAYGSLFSGAEMLFGPPAKDWLWHPMPKNYSFILAGMAPGALILLGMLYGLKNLIWRGSRADVPAQPE
jgi:Na+-translocating ferredoxin:NAD+ oxidoreductase subunit E